MSQNQMLNKKRNNEEMFSREDEWKGNIFEDSNLKHKSPHSRNEYKYHSDSRDLRDIYRNNYTERRDIEFKEYDNNHYTCTGSRYRNNNDSYSNDNRRHRNNYISNNSRVKYEYNNSYNNYKRSDYHRRPSSREFSMKNTGHSIKNKSVSRDVSDSFSENENKLDSKKVSILTKNFNYLIALPKNYKRILQENFDYIYKEVNSRIYDLKTFNPNYFLKDYNEEVLLIDGTIDAKSEALKIVCDYLYKHLKELYKNLSYIKITILVPQHLVGYVIGIDGKSINKIRELSEAKIDISPGELDTIYKRVEISGKSIQIKRASERIYRIVNEYYYSKYNLKKERNDKDSHSKNGLSRSLSENERNIKKKDEEKNEFSNKDEKMIKQNLTSESRSFYSNKSRSYSRKSNSRKNFSNTPHDDNIEYDDKDFKNAKINLKKFLQNNNVTPFITSINKVTDDLKTSTIAFTLDKKSSKSPSKKEIQPFCFDFILPEKFVLFYNNKFWEDIEGKYQIKITSEQTLTKNETTLNIFSFRGNPDNICQALHYLQVDIVNKGKIIN